MSTDKIKIRTPDGTFRVVQGASELIKGYNDGGDYSRISSYGGADKHIHLGTDSPTIYSKRDK